MKLSLPASYSLWPPMQTHFQWSRFTLLRQKFTGVLSILLMINWAIFLSLYTFEIQHSCEPLVGASTCIPCTTADTPQHFWQHINVFDKEASLPSCPVPPKPNLVFVGLVAAVGATVLGAPVVVAIGVGVAVWLAARALLPSSPQKFVL